MRAVVYTPARWECLVGWRGRLAPGLRQDPACSTFFVAHEGTPCTAPEITAHKQGWNLPQNRRASRLPDYLAEGAQFTPNDRNHHEGHDPCARHLYPALFSHRVVEEDGLKCP